MNWAARTRRLAATLTVVTVLLTAGCSGDDESATPSEPTDSLIGPSDAPTLEVEPVTTSGAIVGRLPRHDRNRVEHVVSHLTVRFLEAAYLAGDYPRGDFRDAFPGFTRGAAQVARHDRMLLTNRRIGRKVDEVTPTAIRVRVDLLAVNKHAKSATSRFELKFRTAGKVSKRFRVAGRLLLTKPNGRWRIFGYDVSKGAR